LKRFLFGAAYYPEHWSAAERADDARRMAEAGVNVVRMAEFAWDRMEPRRGELDFSLFDRTIAALGAEGIDTILCTPTATPPRWLTAERPEWMRVDENGRRMDHGTRQHCCTSNEHFRAESRRITHNGLFAHVDYWRFTEELDFLGVDVYPGFAGDAPADAFWAAMTNQRCRAVSGG
jgi:beta-galactosidase GanA